jgi:hypothetical protein
MHVEIGAGLAEVIGARNCLGGLEYVILFVFFQ